MKVELDNGETREVVLAMPRRLRGLARDVTADIINKAKETAAREGRDTLALGPAWVNDKESLGDAVGPLAKGYLTLACVSPYASELNRADGLPPATSARLVRVPDTALEAMRCLAMGSYAGHPDNFCFSREEAEDSARFSDDMREAVIKAVEELGADGALVNRYYLEADWL